MSAPGLTSGAIQAPASSGPLSSGPGAMPNQLAAPGAVNPSGQLFPTAPGATQIPNMGMTQQQLQALGLIKTPGAMAPGQQPFPTAPVPPGATQIPNTGMTQQQLQQSLGLIKTPATPPQIQMSAMTHPVTGALINTKGQPINVTPPVGAMQGRLVPAQTSGYTTGPNNLIKAPLTPTGTNIPNYPTTPAKNSSGQSLPFYQPGLGYVTPGRNVASAQQGTREIYGNGISYSPNIRGSYKPGYGIVR